MFKASLVLQVSFCVFCLAGCAVGSPPPDPISAEDAIKTETDAINAAKRSCTGRYNFNPSEFLKWSAKLSGSVWEVIAGSVEDGEIWTVRFSKRDGKVIEDGCGVLIVN